MTIQQCLANPAFNGIATVVAILIFIFGIIEFLINSNNLTQTTKYVFSFVALSFVIGIFVVLLTVICSNNPQLLFQTRMPSDNTSFVNTFDNPESLDSTSTINDVEITLTHLAYEDMLTQTIEGVLVDMTLSAIFATQTSTAEELSVIETLAAIFTETATYQANMSP